MLIITRTTWVCLRLGYANEPLVSSQLPLSLRIQLHLQLYYT